ncbi:MAG: S9 family peptidase [Flavobacteriales bacterium]|nr:S9 family peptidase [Flavobacteriales bacterium]
MTRLLIGILFSLGWLFLSAQEKKKIDVSSYYKWKTINEEKISDNGSWITYIQKAYKGNDTLVLIGNNGLEVNRFGRCDQYHLDPNEKFLLFNKTLDFDSIRQLKIKKVKKKDWPSDSIGLLNFEMDTTFWFAQVDETFSGEKGNLIGLKHNEKFKIMKEEVKEKKCKILSRRKEESAKKQTELKGEVLTLLNGETGESKIYEHINEVTINEEGTFFAFVEEQLKNDTVILQAIRFGNIDADKEIYSVEGTIKNVSLSKNGKFLAFMSSTDTLENKNYRLYLYSSLDQKLTMILDTVSDDYLAYQAVGDAKVMFNESETRVFLKVGLKPKNLEEDTLPEDEIAKLDLWSWTDGRIQPQQLKSAKKDASGFVDYVYNIDSKKLVQLSDTLFQSLKFNHNNEGDFAMLSDQSPYLKEMTWDFWYFDVFRVDLNTGNKMKLGEHLFGWDYSLSPSGRYFTFWNPMDSSWYLKDLNRQREINLTKGLKDKFYRMHHDVPSKIEAHGKVYWLEDELACAIESQNDLWIIPIEGKPYKFTNGASKNESYELLRLDEDEVYINLINGFYLKAFNHRTKSELIYHYTDNGLEKLVEWDAKLLTIIQSKDKEHIVFEKMSFTESYDLFLTNSSFQKPIRISDINPQQKDYLWGTVELFSWKDYNGDSISGLLYKPENFDENKKYPMIVYFYERYTDDLHIYYRPKPTASIVFPTEYTSNGYVVFIPDITYKTGYPAQGAYNAIMSGTDAILQSFPNIDSTRMGLQGQSWGGYQTAQMVTMTGRFKCAMAGAPVSNMFSAYGGIRWGTGLSRTFQYETGQSRIGATIWEAPELYFDNSPLFHLTKVETPLLIMHNDGDGAVPWYQGIELYNGLRRLNKPVWLLNYNEDEHNLMKEANRLDLSIRMRQFFDHYLMDEQAPVWLKNGIPAIIKGEDFGFGYK